MAIFDDDGVFVNEFFRRFADGHYAFRGAYGFNSMFDDDYWAQQQREQVEAAYAKATKARPQAACVSGLGFQVFPLRKGILFYQRDTSLDDDEVEGYAEDKRVQRRKRHTWVTEAEDG